jgi:hypothetical protein
MLKEILALSFLSSALLVPTFDLKAADWNSCADDLDSLRRAARDANEAAAETQSKETDYEDCRQFPDIHDLLHDGCRSDRSEYQSSVANLSGELDTVQRRMRSVTSSCGMTSQAIAGAPSSRNRMCDLYRSYKGQLPAPTLLKTCKENLPEAQCIACLGN